jgi:putative nucleotidyltransferase with HDIG domain
MIEKKPQSIRTFLETVSTIPTLSIVIDKITRLLQNPQTSAEEIGKVIMTDQALASKVLRLVNSAFYGFPGRISTISHAVVILGFSTIKNIVLTASIFDAFAQNKNTASDFSIEQFWLHSIGCGAASQAIAKRVGFKEKEECFIAGLIHDIGKIIMCYFFPEIFNSVSQNARNKDILFLESEREVIGITHDEIGAIIARRWNLPANLQSVVQNHHSPAPEKDFYSMTSIVHVADILTRAMEIGNGGDEKMPLIIESTWRDLGLEHIPLEPLLEGIEEEFDRATIFMQIL